MTPNQIVGELRKSQAVHTFGIGATIDLPNFTVIGLGTEFWNQASWNPTLPINAIDDDRLLGLIRRFLGPSVRRLTVPPDAAEKGETNPVGIPVAMFPRWGRCPRCELIAPFDQGHFRFDSYPGRPDSVKFTHANCPRARNKDVKVNPVRFVVACTNGHLMDFPWERYIQGAGCTCSPVGPLRLQEQGVSSEVANLWLRCDGCNASRPMTQAFQPDENGRYVEVGDCSGHHPHFGLQHTSSCSDATPRPMLLGASNQWFPLMMSALTLPRQAGKLGALIEQYWQRLQVVQNNVEVLNAFMQIGDMPELNEYPQSEIMDAIARKSQGGSAGDAERVEDLKIEEWPYLIGQGTGTSDEFKVRQSNVPQRFARHIEALYQVPRLRIVKAMTGFTRIDSPGDYSDLVEIEPTKRVPLSGEDPEWVPAYEVRGEGIFIKISEDALEDWRQNPTVLAREELLKNAYIAFRASRGIEPADDGFDVLRYTLLHTISHALIRQFSIECGYASASIQERIYSIDANHASGKGPMAGILLMTAAADSEGTLGGLVSLGETSRFERHFRKALERATLCASDPLCSENEISADGRTLHGAACHACMFVSETSCERSNRLVDRLLLVSSANIGTNSTVTPFFDIASYSAGNSE